MVTDRAENRVYMLNDWRLKRNFNLNRYLCHTTELKLVMYLIG